MNDFNYTLCFNDMDSNKGIILPSKHFISYFPILQPKNASKILSNNLKKQSLNMALLDSTNNAFPFNIPFHPGGGPEIIYPDGPLEPEDPEEDPGDEPDDN